MSEFQYYEFQAIDRLLSEADRQSLRMLSTRARITASSFTNSYDWGDFKGDPAELVARWFDLHLYLANWGTRRLMIRLPRRSMDGWQPDRFLRKVDDAEVTVSGDHLIVDITRDELDLDEDIEDGTGWLAALAPLRTDLLGGDLRLFYLLWLIGVEAGGVRPEEAEPLPGIGPLTGALAAFAAFFLVDADLVAAAAERPLEPIGDTAADAAPRFVAGLSEGEKTALLVRVAAGDVHVADELRALARRFRSATASPAEAPRTAGDLLRRAQAIRAAREAVAAEQRAAAAKRQAAEDARQRRARLDAIMRRGEGVWREIDTEIERRNASGYDKAARLLADLKCVAEDRGGLADFARRLDAIRERHARKGQLIARLRALT